MNAAFAFICGHGLGDLIRDFGPVIALIGVATTLWINGRRDERRRRQENHARAMDAVTQYYEMPLLIRRRRDTDAAGERARLSERFADVQAELASCEALIRADTDPAVRNAYAQLVAALREHAGGQASAAWKTRPITSDDEMGMGDVIAALTPISAPRTACEQAMAASTISGRSKPDRRLSFSRK